VTRALLIRLGDAVADDRGVTAAEYAILGVGIVLIIGSAVLAFGSSLAAAFDLVRPVVGIGP
jgi:Flp pilus assembly pilin Flp